jgi:type IV secretory pathway VirB3-like protein
MLDERPLATHQIAVGNTRPAVVPVVNVPLKDCVVWGIFAMEAASYRIQFVPVIAAGFFFACTLYRKDYNAGRCFVSWLMTSASDLAARSLGGTSIPAEPGRGAFRGIAHGRADA